MSKSLLGPYTKLRLLVIGGERCPSSSMLRSWKADGNKTRLINIYGVTEVSCWASWYEITDHDLQLSVTLTLLCGCSGCFAGFMALSFPVTFTDISFK